MVQIEKKTPLIPKSAFIAEGAVVRGDIILGEESSVWFHTTIRADHANIIIGDGTKCKITV